MLTWKHCIFAKIYNFLQLLTIFKLIIWFRIFLFLTLNFSSQIPLIHYCCFSPFCIQIYFSFEKIALNDFEWCLRCSFIYIFIYKYKNFIFLKSIFKILINFLLIWNWHLVILRLNIIIGFSIELLKTSEFGNLIYGSFNVGSIFIILFNSISVRVLLSLKCRLLNRYDFKSFLLFFLFLYIIIIIYIFFRFNFYLIRLIFKLFHF